MVLGPDPGQPGQPGLRLVLARRDRAGPFARRPLLFDRLGRPLSQPVPAAAHVQRGRRLGTRSAGQAQPDPVPCRLPGQPAHRLPVLVVRRAGDLGGAAAASADRAERRRFGPGVLGQRHRRLAVAKRPQGAARAAGGSVRRHGDGRRLRGLPRAVRALVPVQQLHADAACPWQPPQHGDLDLRRGGRDDPGQVPAPALCLDALHLFAWLRNLPHRRSLHARPVHGLRAGSAGGQSRR